MGCVVDADCLYFCSDGGNHRLTIEAEHQLQAALEFVVARRARRPKPFVVTHLCAGADGDYWEFDAGGELLAMGGRR